jgi:PAS domain S-box-containing protein
MKESPVKSASFRNRVAKFLKNSPDSRSKASAMSPERPIEELHIHQIELEMQNEDLRLARENAEQLREKYLDLYEFAPVGYISLDQNLKIFEANITATKLLGAPKSQIISHKLTDFIAPESQDILYFYLDKVKNSKILEACELKLKKLNEKPFFAHLEGVAICKEESDRAEIRISFSNINENKQHELALKESARRNEMLLNMLPHSAFLIDRDRKVIVANRRAKNNGVRVGEVCQAHNLTENVLEPSHFEDPQNIYCLVDENTYRQRLFTVIDDSNDAVCLMDLQGNIKAWNRMAEKMYGYSADEAIRMSVFDLVPARLKQQTINFLSDIRAGVLVKPFETKRIAKDGSVIDVCLTVTRMVQNGEIVAITTTERDITNHNLLAESLQKLPRRIIMAQEDERSRISQVLHSELGQALITLKLFIVVTASRQASENDAMRTVFDKIRAQLDKIINDTRNLAHKLSPPGLKYTGLIPAIRELVESATSEKLQIQFLHNGGNNACFKKKDIIIYRILQEALQNIIKHSEATRARVSVVLKKTAFSLEVCDNGKGFNTSFQSSAKGLGLALMKQQAALIYGKLSIESQEGKGTLLKVRIPLKERNAK